MIDKKKTINYVVIRKALSKELCDFIYNYMLIQRDAVDLMMKHNQLNPYNPFMGTREDKQIPGAYSKYGDWAMEALLVKMIPIMKKKTGLELIPTYSYTRLYEKGNILKRHKDRPSCEVSTTLHLGGDEWPIFVDPSGQDFVIDEYKNIHKPGAPKGVRVDLKQGDMLIYAGCELEHWREPFQGNICSQVFLHYNHANGPYAKTNLLDTRPILGVPHLPSK
jgi:hypothetical protein|tara:strand:+ start:2103 stop:2765 length:663 start_codon:yes stop_codon:yes gene_type:complete